VDRAVPAMRGDAILLENLIVRGHQDRLALVFTNFRNISASAAFPRALAEAPSRLVF
jgi:hypothetical protein